MFKLLFMFSVLVMANRMVDGSHFRYGTFSVKPKTDLGTNVLMEFKVSLCYRRSYGSSFYCDLNTIQQNQPVAGEGNIIGYSACTGQSFVLSDSSLNCTSFSQTDDWTCGQKIFDYQLPKNCHYTASFDGNAWISLAQGGNGDWNVRASFNTYLRSDKNSINTNPIALITPIVPVQVNKKNRIVIPVADNDFDVVKCRRASLYEECGSICNVLPNSNVEADSCILNFDTSGLNVNALYGVSLQIEDYASQNSSIPISSTPLQFLIHVIKSTNNCTIAPLIESNRPIYSNATVNSVISEIIMVHTGCDDHSINEIIVQGPPGLIYTKPIYLSNTTWYVNYTWTPNDNSVGQNLITITTTDSGNLNTLQNFYINILLPELELNKECCDLRNENCSELIGSGDYILGENLYLKIQLIENLNNSIQIHEDYALIELFRKQNNIQEFQINLNKLNELALYKNIHFGSNYKTSTSQVNAKVFISYSNSSFNQLATLVLYDSKCRYCNQSLIKDSCEIDGVCYASGETLVSDNTLVCDPTNDKFDWTLISTLQTTDMPTTEQFTATLEQFTTTTPVLLDLTHVAFDPSTVIVWEKCGIEVRTKITKIFQSIHQKNQTTLLYDPSIHVLVLQIKEDDLEIHQQIIKLPALASEVLFFLFNEPNKIIVYLDCPSVSKTKLVIDVENFSSIKYMELFQNSKAFESLAAAMDVFRCKASAVVLPGTVINFHGQLSITSSSLLLSFVYDKESFSLSIQNGLFVITSSSHQSITVNLTSNITTTTGIYLLITNTGLEFYVSCPINQKPAGIWQTNMFKSKLTIETSRHYLLGNAITASLLNAFCSTNNIANVINYNSSVSCISSSTIKANVDSIEQANRFAFSFLPSNEIMKQINAFDSMYTLNFAQLVENEPKILIASRRNSDPEFFYKGIADYSEGFTDGQSNFWIGLNTMHKVTSQHNYKLRVVATTPSGIDFVEEYLIFNVGDQTDGYRLNVSGLVLGTNGYFARNHGAQFSTFDFNNITLARKHAAGYWFKTELFYCFSCVSNVYEKGTAANIYLSEAKNVEIFTTKMYLVPTERIISLPFSDSLIVSDVGSVISLLSHEFLFNDQISRFVLVYRGSRDGFTARAFHTKVDSYQKTFTIVKSDYGNIFGGYTEVGWSGATGNRNESNALIYSLQNQYNKPIVLRAGPNKNSIYVVPTYFAVFGNYNAYDIYIADNCDTVANSGSQLGSSSSSYTSAFTAALPGITASTFLGGASKFLVSEIEVYARLD
jgi:hypothetical protein